MWALCSTNFLAKFFPMGKTNALRGKITSFQQQHDESVPKAWEQVFSNNMMNLFQKHGSASKTTS